VVTTTVTCHFVPENPRLPRLFQCYSALRHRVLTLLRCLEPYLALSSVTPHLSNTYAQFRYTPRCDLSSTRLSLPSLARHPPRHASPFSAAHLSNPRPRTSP
jgi:hypothetical protein